jgi:phage protein D
MPEAPLLDSVDSGRPTSETYNRSQTVPNNNKQIPVVNDPADKSYVTSPSVKKAHDRAAASHLRRKNRKGNSFVIELPLTLTLESGTRYNVSGFSKVADEIEWLIGEVTHTLSAKHGSETRVTLVQSMARIPVPGLSGANVGADSGATGSGENQVVAVHRASDRQIKAAQEAGDKAIGKK